MLILPFVHRNGRGLTKNRLKALTVIHNFLRLFKGFRLWSGLGEVEYYG